MKLTACLFLLAGLFPLACPATNYTIKGTIQDGTQTDSSTNPMMDGYTTNTGYTIQLDDSSISFANITSSDTLEFIISAPTGKKVTYHYYTGNSHAIRLKFIFGSADDTVYTPGGTGVTGSLTGVTGTSPTAYTGFDFDRTNDRGYMMLAMGFLSGFSEDVSFTGVDLVISGTDFTSFTSALSVGACTITGSCEGSSAALSDILTLDDNLSVSTVSDASSNEGVSQDFTVDLSTTMTADTTFDLALADGTAEVSTDYGAASTLTFSDNVTYDSTTKLITVPSGVSSFTVTVPTYIHVDSITDLTYTLTVGGVSGTGTIKEVPGYTDKDPFEVTQTNSTSYAEMSQATSSNDFYYEIGENVTFSDGLLLAGSAGNDYLDVDAGYAVTTVGDLQIGSFKGANGYLTLNAGSVFNVGGNLTLGGDGSGEIYVDLNSLLSVAGTLTQADDNDILLGYSSTAFTSGYLALKGSWSVSSALSDYSITYWTKSASVAATTDNTIAVYFDGSSSKYSDSYLNTDVFSSFGLDLDGYTVISYSPMDLTWMDAGWQSGYWFSDTWYTGFIYYIPTYGLNFWHTAHGWQYAKEGNTASASYFWDYTTSTWWYTDQSYYPWIYVFSQDGDGNWGGNWYRYDSGVAPNRQFYDWSNGVEVADPSFSATN